MLPLILSWLRKRAIIVHRKIVMTVFDLYVKVTGKGNPIENAYIRAEWNGNVVEKYTDENGLAVISGIPSNINSLDVYVDVSLPFTPTLVLTEDWEGIFTPTIVITEDWEGVFTPTHVITEDWEEIIPWTVKVTEDWESAFTPKPHITEDWEREIVSWAVKITEDWEN